MPIVHDPATGRFMATSTGSKSERHGEGGVVGKYKGWEIKSLGKNSSGEHHYYARQNFSGSKMLSAAGRSPAQALSRLRKTIKQEPPQSSPLKKRSVERTFPSGTGESTYRPSGVSEPLRRTFRL